MKKAGVRANLLTGTYKLQERLSKFQGGKVSTQCRMCNSGEEDMQHFILGCTSLKETRERYLIAINKILEDHGLVVFFRRNQHLLMQLIMDPTHPKLPLCLQTQENLAEIEAINRSLCYALHCRRCALLDIPIVK